VRFALVEVSTPGHLARSVSNARWDAKLVSENVQNEKIVPNHYLNRQTARFRIFSTPRSHLPSQPTHSGLRAPHFVGVTTSDNTLLTGGVGLLDYTRS
jgi:hypothetical protein